MQPLVVGGTASAAGVEHTPPRKNLPHTLKRAPPPHLPPNPLQQLSSHHWYTPSQKSSVCRRQCVEHTKSLSMCALKNNRSSPQLLKCVARDCCGVGGGVVFCPHVAGWCIM